MLPLLSEAGIKPVVACLFRRDAGVEERVVNQGFDVRFLPSGRMTARTIALRRMILSERPGLIHTTIFESDIIGRLAAIRTGTKVITSLVNTSYEPTRLRDPNVSRMRLTGAQLLDGWTARHLTTRFHALTETVKQAAVKTLRIAEDKITVIGRGRDPERLGRPGPDRRRESRRRLGLNDNDEVLVNVGRQEFQKGHRYLLEAIDSLVKNARLLLLIAGREGNATPQLRALSQRPTLSGRVRFLGHREDIPDLLAAADLFLFPSLYEGFGGAVIEAMALGLPIIASDLPAIREVVEPGRNALLAQPQSPDKLASAIETLLSDRERARAFGKRSREIFEERFTLDRMTEQMIDLYRTVMTGSNSPRLARMEA
jgi:glycosyltransferase involved in cell wall biosynthesis